MNLILTEKQAYRIPNYARMGHVFCCNCGIMPEVKNNILPVVRLQPSQLGPHHPPHPNHYHPEYNRELIQNLTRQGSKGIRQWPINLCTSPMMILKGNPSVDYK